VQAHHAPGVEEKPQQRVDMVGRVINFVIALARRLNHASVVVDGWL